MKILYVHNNYGNNNSGEEHASKALADLLERNGHKVEWYRKRSDIIGGSLLAKIKAFVCGIINIQAVLELRRIIKEVKPDIVQIQNLYPFISPAILVIIKLEKIPIVMRCPNYRLFCPTGLHLDSQQKVCERCLGVGRELNCIKHNCERNFPKSVGYAARNYIARTIWGLHSAADAYIVQSDFQRRKFASNGIDESKLFVVPGLTPSLNSPIPGGDTEQKYSALGDYVSFIGRASVEKGIKVFIQAASQLPHIKFLIAGTVDPSLKKLVEETPQNIHWLGFLSGKAFDGVFRKSRIVVVPSTWYEGFPNVITRAMGHSRPVIATNIGAMQSIIDHEKTGILVQPGEASALRDAIKSLHSDPRRCIQYGVEGRTKALHSFNEETILSNLLKVYEVAQLRNKTNSE